MAEDSFTLAGGLRLLIKSQYNDDSKVEAFNTNLSDEKIIFAASKKKVST